jgi:hypothetical protein
LGSDIEKHKAQEANRQQLEGTKLGVEIARDKERSLVERVRSVQPGKTPER